MLQQGQHVLERFQVELEPAAFAAAVERGKTLDLATAMARVRLALTLPITTGRPAATALRQKE